MSIDWKRVLKGAAGVTVAAALCVAAAMPANGADGDTDGTDTDSVTPGVVTTPIDGCDAVKDWAVLTTCLAASDDGLVVVDGLDAKGGDQITVKGAKTLSGSLNASENGGPMLVVGTGVTLTLDSGFSYQNGKRQLARLIGGNLTVLGGTYSRNDVSGNDSKNGSNQGSLAYIDGGRVTIKGGDLSNNIAGDGGVLFANASGKSGKAFVTIQGGTFRENVSTSHAKDKNGKSTSGGGVIYGYGGANISITGGHFEGNRATKGGNGGVIHSFGTGVITVSGTGTNIDQAPVVFKNNIQDPGECAPESFALCDTERNGGGVIFMDELGANNMGTLLIQGNVLFEGNGEKSSDYYSGGGAIWARANLKIKNGVDGGRPMFRNNWSTIQQPSAEAKLQRGGAGGAIFLMIRSTAVITGGVYENNTSGYLGGAIYTEENTVTYVGKTVAFGNTAGHFGGGLWFCPSGNSTASRGGNIALFDNSVNPDIDSNMDNAPTKDPALGKDKVTYAGSDLAIMNPAAKGLGDNQFLLMNTWFTDRAEAAVSWHWDNTPLKESSGFRDSWMQGNRDKAVVASTTMHLSEETVDEGVITLTKDTVTDKTDKRITTGAAFKAEVLGKDDVARNAAKSKAEANAQITITGNRSRLSGGGFGSNGVVIFDTPYSMNWDKVATKTVTIPDTNKNDVVADEKNPIKLTSTWTLAYVKKEDDKTAPTEKEDDAPYFEYDQRPTDCQIEPDKKDDCWSWHADGTNGGVWMVDIIDNGDRDTNPDWGAFGVDNLRPGVYEMVEKTAPSGYRKTNNVYEFTVVAANPEENKVPVAPTLTIKTKAGGAGPISGNAIGNTPIKGVLAWTKTGEGNKAIGGSEWQIMKVDKTFSHDVTDCTSDQTGACTATLDENTEAGHFEVSLTKADGTPDSRNWPNGEYTLIETKAPTGYWLPENPVHTFTINWDNESNPVTWTSKDSENNTETGQFANEIMSVKWTKIGNGSDKTPLAGSEWTLSLIENNKPVEKSTWTITDCDKTCADSESPHDSNTAVGEFMVTGLKSGTYELTEKTPPTGYIKSDKAYTFKIEDGQHTITDVKISISDGQTSTPVEGNAITNVKAVSALPFTGGRSGLDWLLLGGGIALAAALAALATGRVKRHEL